MMKPSLPSAGDFNQLRAFVAVAGSLNFSRAAENLGVSSSALSQMVRGLEERVGVSLFNRTTRSVSLTEAGARLFERVRPAVEELAEALGETRERRAHPTGTVRLHCFRAAADLYLTPILRDFSDTYPQVVLDVTLDDAVVNIVAEGYDVAIRLGEVIDKDLIAVKLGPDLRQTVVASPDYLARHGTPAHPRDLLAHRCIAWRWPGQKTPYKWEFMENGKWFEVAIDGPLISNMKDFGVQAAVDGVGVAFASQQLIAPHIAEGRLVALLEPWSAPFPGYYLCYPAQRQMAPPLRAVIDTIRTGPRKRNGAEAAAPIGAAVQGLRLHR
ncbi:LysR family transcriptional regulator [Rhizobium viscosum]|uniref:DNA-binding transcriptional LysR family regulator n=1 Tax=Rhizobium viscosum TaxID=1673 RepID=A0ABR9IVH3_RHIVS|nr:LysR family transcriptional regulator [Rhizobium viscosum]MBE1506812.1 DNA-binding transcriptional LysR family regulator [Rhizobium viscosum]